MIKEFCFVNSFFISDGFFNMSSKIIRLVRRARKKNSPQSFFPTYDFCVVNKAQNGKKVVEKLGTLNIGRGFFSLNAFRLVFWVSRGVGLSGNSLIVLERYNIIRL